jgi:hypothetical protein
LTYRFNTIPIKIPVGHFIDKSKLILKFIWKGKGNGIFETLLKGKNEFTITLLVFKSSFKTRGMARGRAPALKKKKLTTKL